MSESVEAGPPMQRHVLQRTPTMSVDNSNEIRGQGMDNRHNTHHLSDIQLRPSFVNASVALDGIKKVRCSLCGLAWLN